MSGNESKAWDLIAKCRFIWKNLPDFMQVPLAHEARGWLAFGNGSEIRAIPSTERAGAGTDATLVVRDELREHPEGHANYVAISPCIDSGGQIIDLSTYDKYTPYDQNHFAQRVSKGMKGAVKQEVMPNFEFYDGVEHACLIFLGWPLRPVRMENLTLQEWYAKEVIPKYSPQDREQEYPATLAEAIAPPVTTSFFNVHAVNEMLLQVVPPLQDVTGINTFNGVVHVWKLPVVGRSYVVATDPSDGIEDPFATVVMDKQTGEWVAIATAKYKADQAAVVHDSLVRSYNNAYNSCETNANSGGKFIQTLEKLETPNLAPRRDTKGQIVRAKNASVVKGWYTTPEHKDIMLDDFEEAIRLNLISVHHRDAIDQFRNFIKDENGKKRASTGHDDFVMAGALAWQLQRYIIIVAASISSGHYKG